MSTNPTDRERAALAAYLANKRDKVTPLVNDYARRTGGEDLDTDASAVIVDLVADLLHLARARGVDPRAVTETARMHFEDDEDGVVISSAVHYYDTAIKNARKAVENALWGYEHNRRHGTFSEEDGERVHDSETLVDYADVLASATRAFLALVDPKVERHP